MRVYVQNLAGCLVAFQIRAGATVGEFRSQVYAERVVEGELSRMRLFVDCANARGDGGTDVVESKSASENDAAPEAYVTLIDDARTLASYDVLDETTVHVVMRAPEPGELLRTFGAFGLAGMCVSAAADELFVLEINESRNCIQVF